MTEPDYIEPKIPSEKLNKRKIIIYSLLAILAFLVLRALYIAMTYMPPELGYTTIPIRPDEPLPAWIGPKTLLEEAKQLESKDWVLTVSLPEFPEKYEEIDRKRVELYLLQNFCGTAPTQRTRHPINHVFYNKDKKELFKFTIAANECRDFFSKDYINRYYNEVFQEAIEKNVEQSSESLPMYVAEDLAVRKISFSTKDKQVITEYTQFPQENKGQEFNDKTIKEEFVQASCSRLMDNLLSTNGYTYSLVYHNPKGEVIHTINIPAYSC